MKFVLRFALGAATVAFLLLVSLSAPPPASAGLADPDAELPQFPATSPQGVIDLALFPIAFGHASYRVQRAFEDPYDLELTQLLTIVTVHADRPRSELWLGFDVIEGFSWLCRAHHGGRPVCQAIAEDDVDAQVAAVDATLGAAGFFQRIVPAFRPLLETGRVTRSRVGREPVSCLEGRTARGPRRLCVTQTAVPTLLRIDDRLRVRARSFVLDFPIEHLLPPVAVPGLPDLPSLEDDFTRRLAGARRLLGLGG